MIGCDGYMEQEVIPGRNADKSIITMLMQNRGIVSDEEIDKYFHGGILDLYSPNSMKGIQEAGELLLHKIREGKYIRIIGDYDVDGIMASYILQTGLERLGAVCDVRIPHRVNDGYGLNGRMVCQAYLDGIDTIVTCDNGIASYTWMEILKKLGISTVVTDHHEVSYSEQEDGSREYIIPHADVVIDPKQPGCMYPFKCLCGAGVAWKLICYLYDKAGISKNEQYNFLEFVCIATISDVMDLKDENRIIVTEGLKRISKTENIGLRELIRQNNIDIYQIDVDEIGFTLGPCLNASGRLDTADLAMNLLESEDDDIATELAQKLKILNEQRKEMTTQWVEQAIKLVELNLLTNGKVLVIYLHGCHESIIGLVAGKLKEYYHKPVFVLTNSVHGVMGSGRSIEAYFMYEELCKCKECFIRFGGHRMAAGFLLIDNNIDKFRHMINESCQLTDEDLVRKVNIDMQIPLNCINKEFVNQFDILKPFGKGNQKPVFVSENLKVLSPRIIGKNKNVVKMVVVDETGYTIDAIYFGSTKEFVNYVTENVKLTLTYSPSINSYMGRENLQITIIDYK